MDKVTSRAPLVKARPARIMAGREDHRRRSRHWYHTTDWRRLRREVIAQAVADAAERGEVLRCPHCGVALLARHPDPASPVVHHKIPHRGDRDLFFDRANLEVVAKGWHDTEAQRIERAGA